METENFTLEFSDIVYDVVNNSTNQKLRSMKRLIGGCSGVIKSGCITAVMGPSGSCKTTFLDFLIGRVQKGSRACGEVLFRNAPRDYNVWDKQYAYLEQDDYIVIGQTVYDFVKFSVSCRRTDMDPLTVETNINELMEKLQINHLRDIDVGSISGGERKRMMIAIEMAVDADILILDEPTSGLDSNLALKLVYILKDYAANRNKIVLMSIHQPGPGLFELIDNLFFFYKGAIMYDGAVSDLDKFFEENGFVCENLLSKPELLFELFSKETVFADVRQMAGNVEKLKDSVFKYQEKRYGEAVLLSENVFDAFGLGLNMRHVRLILGRALGQGIRKIWNIFKLAFLVLANVSISFIVCIVLFILGLSFENANFVLSVVLLALNNSDGFKFENICKIRDDIMGIFGDNFNGISSLGLGEIIRVGRTVYSEFIRIPWARTWLYDMIFSHTAMVAMGICFFLITMNPFYDYILHGNVQDEIRKNIYAVGSLFVATFILSFSFAFVITCICFGIAVGATKMWAVGNIAMLTGVSLWVALSVAFMLVLFIVIRKSTFLTFSIGAILGFLLFESCLGPVKLVSSNIKFNEKGASVLQNIAYVAKYIVFVNPATMLIRVLHLFFPYDCGIGIKVNNNIVKSINSKGTKSLLDKIIAYKFRTGCDFDFKIATEIREILFKIDGKGNDKDKVESLIRKCNEEQMEIGTGLLEELMNVFQDDSNSEQRISIDNYGKYGMLKGFLRLIFGTEMPYAYGYDILCYVMSLIFFAIFSYVILYRKHKQEHYTLLRLTRP